MSEEGGGVKRWVLEGTDYVYPRTTNKILEAFLKSKSRSKKLGFRSNELAWSSVGA